MMTVWMCWGLNSNWWRSSEQVPFYTRANPPAPASLRHFRTGTDKNSFSWKRSVAMGIQTQRMDASLQSRSASDDDSTGGHCTFYVVDIPEEDSITQLSLVWWKICSVERCICLTLLDISIKSDGQELQIKYVNHYQSVASSSSKWL